MWALTDGSFLPTRGGGGEWGLFHWDQLSAVGRSRHRMDKLQENENCLCVIKVKLKLRGLSGLVWNRAVIVGLL